MARLLLVTHLRWHLMARIPEFLLENTALGTCQIRLPLIEHETTPHSVQRKGLLEAVVPGAFPDFSLQREGIWPPQGVTPSILNEKSRASLVFLPLLCSFHTSLCPRGNPAPLNGLPRPTWRGPFLPAQPHLSIFPPKASFLYSSYTLPSYSKPLHFLPLGTSVLWAPSSFNFSWWALRSSAFIISSSGTLS